jgi:membrane-bound lytic murein transglycosylase D
MKISKLILTFSLVSGIAFTNQTFAQIVPESLEDRLLVIPDTLIEEVKIQYPIEMTVADIRDGKEYQIKIEDPAIVEKRLKAIENIMPMVYNESVKKYLDFFLIKRPSFTKKMMEDKDIYFPIFEKYLAANNMPQELKYLSLLESGLDPKAISRSKAVGLWQFMSFTGKEMGLTINESVDERMHIEKSTDAACKYLKTLYNMFEDWDLALASYNTGPGRIRRTIKSTGLGNYWDLHPYIHPDTRAYVPQFIALAYLMNYGTEHGISPEIKREFVNTDKIYVDGYINLKTFASLSQIDFEDIKTHNPHFKTDILPDSPRGYEIAIPNTKYAYFNSNRNSILDSASKRPILVIQAPVNAPILATIEETEPTSETASTSNGPIVIGRKGLVPDLVVNNDDDDDAPVKYQKLTKDVKKIHKVKRGEFLNKIADKYNVNIADIKKWNGMRRSKVLVGESLTIYVKETRKVKANSLAAKSSSENIKALYHTVKKGDTLWNISQRYDGVTIADIKKWNKISGNSVKVGQKIKIKV